MKCVKVPRRLMGKVRVKRAPGYEILYEGDFALIPVSEVSEGLEVVECNPPLRRETPRLNEIVPGISSFYIVGDIMVISPKRELTQKEIERIMGTYNRVKAIYLRRKVTGELRVNELVHLAGEKRTTTTFNEGGLKYFVDLAKVYVNPSLATERLKIVDSIPQGSRVLDAFTGYGALALQLARKLGYVVAGDLNLDGLMMASKSAKLNSSKLVLDLVHFDAHNLPFRDKAFDLAIGDNPTMIDEFVDELCRVSRSVILYKLGRIQEGWEKVNDYSKDLVIMKRVLRCDE
ncbi:MULTISPECIES: class I SAM-dependent methyltransferase family protein [Metallosphaera]|uniref:class I SAM-dependent methyltransferase n=1 Tax=Metallosphaera TaxID=41980 RepID=UPI001F05D28B|nr:methyltransferase domain-containing protein [Metallosphaera sedula]MCH1771743.1 methyltransferase domain-containing protein [Metallosphaera sedula]MCP6728341.1 methyltransferase domain-containing protein [Metallosphaera sedula]